MKNCSIGSKMMVTFLLVLFAFFLERYLLRCTYVVFFRPWQVSRRVYRGGIPWHGFAFKPHISLATRHHFEEEQFGLASTFACTLRCFFSSDQVRRKIELL